MESIIIKREVGIVLGICPDCGAVVTSGSPDVWYDCRREWEYCDHCKKTYAVPQAKKCRSNNFKRRKRWK